MADRAALIRRLEEATGPSRELDADIYEALGHTVKRARGPYNRRSLTFVWFDERSRKWRPMGMLTASIDAAMTLVPEGHEWLRKDPRVMTVYKIPSPDAWAVHIDAAGATPALALCIASLRAREEA